MLVKFTAKKKSQWDESLDTCVFAYNTSRHESTCFTPFELMFGRKATLAINIEMCKDAADDCLKRILNVGELSPSEVEQMAAEHLQWLNEAKENIKVAQQKQKELYDRKHANLKVYQVGSKGLEKGFCTQEKEEKWMPNLWGLLSSQKALVKAYVRFSRLRTQIVSLIE